MLIHPRARRRAAPWLVAARTTTRTAHDLTTKITALPALLSSALPYK